MFDNLYLDEIIEYVRENPSVLGELAGARGGQEQDAFTVTPPLPQASDPSRNWRVDSEDDSFTLGTNLTWLVRPAIEVKVWPKSVDLHT